VYNSFVNFEIPKIVNNKPEEKKIPSLRERVPFYQIESIMDALNKQFPESQERVKRETVENIFYAYLEQRLNNTHIYESEKYKVSFPYTVNNTADLAKTLYKQYAGELPTEKNPDSTQSSKLEKEKKDKEFLFANFFTLDWGSEFTFQEEVMHEMIQGLPGAMNNIKEGRDLFEKEIYTLGPPTNVLSTMSKEFLEGTNSSGKGIDTKLGDLYAEFIEKDMTKDKKANILLRGISMSASFALATGEKLLHDGAVTQNMDEYKNDENKKPFMQIHIDTPPAQIDRSPFRRAIQTGLGFAIPGIYSKYFNPYMRVIKKNDDKFLKDKNAFLLEEKGIKQNNSKEQDAMKNELIMRVIKNLLTRGFPAPKDLKFTEVIGTQDPTMWSPMLNLKLMVNKLKFLKKDNLRKDELGRKERVDDIRQNMIQTTENRRTFGAKMPHLIPYLRKNELERIKRAVDALEGLKK
jgi:hypothetical protein